MDSSELYHIKQLFCLGAYKSLVALPLPDSGSPDLSPTLLYQIRSHLALDDPKSALKLIPSGTENVALKAASSLAKFTGSADATAKEAALEELRDLSVEIEGDDVEGTERDKATVRVLAGTAFARAGEVEEALETLGSETEDLEAVAVIVQIYLSIHRPDLAKRQFERAKRWAEDDLLLQLIESTIGLVASRDSYHNSYTFYSEQLGNPSLSSPHILTARGVTRILRNEFQEAKSDLEESLQQGPGDSEATAAYAVANALAAGTAPWPAPSKPNEIAQADEVWQKLVSEYPAHPLVVDVSQKADLFDEAASNFVVPPLAVATA